MSGGSGSLELRHRHLEAVPVVVLAVDGTGLDPAPHAGGAPPAPGAHGYPEPVAPNAPCSRLSRRHVVPPDVMSDLARLATCLQMLLDLVVVGAVVRLIINAAKVDDHLEV